MNTPEERIEQVANHIVDAVINSDHISDLLSEVTTEEVGQLDEEDVFQEQRWYAVYANAQFKAFALAMSKLRYFPTKETS